MRLRDGMNENDKWRGCLLAAHPDGECGAVVPDGIEPSFPGCGPSVVAIGPRDRIVKVESPGVAPGFPACDAGVFLWTMTPCL